MDNLLFFGELPPASLHGASISNATNIEMLKENFNIIIVIEQSNIKVHGAISILKIITFLSDWFNFLKTSIIKKNTIFYGIIYLSTFGILKNILLASTFKLFNPYSKIILHFHRSDFNHFKKRRINNFLFKFLNLFINRYIVLSNREKVNFTNNNNIYVLNNTIEKEFNHNELIKSENEKQYDLHITYIGNFIIEKGIFELVQAIKEINEIYPKIRLELYGEYSSNAIKESLTSLIYNDPNLSIRPVIYGLDKFNIINNTDLMILPSYNEGLPITLLECLYIGKPIIITKVGYIPDVLGDNYPLYCTSKSVDSIKSIISKFCEPGIINLNEKILKNIYQNYSHSSHRKQLLDIFNFTQS